MTKLKIVLVSFMIWLGLALTSYAYDIVQVTDTPEVDEADYSVAIFGNTVYAVWTGKGLYFDKSTDLGKTWNRDPQLIDASGGVPKILIDKFGNLFVLYKDKSDHLCLLKSHDGGNSFVQLWRDVSYSPSYTFDFCIDETGNIIYIVRSQYMGGGYNYNTYICKSIDGGQTFSAWKMIFAVWAGSEVKVQTNRDGKEVYFLVGVYSNRYRINFSKSIDYGENFGPLKEIYQYAQYDWIWEMCPAIGKNGKIYISWTDKYSWNYSLKVFLSESSDGGENFLHSIIATGDDPTTPSAYRASIFIDDLGNVYTAFHKGDEDVVLPVLAEGIYFDKRLGTGMFGVDKFITGPLINSGQPLIAVTPDGKTAFIMWNNAATVDANRDLYCTTFPTNQPPVLAPIGNKQVNEGELLDFIVAATDADGDALTYSASNLPQGATFDTQTHRFTWMPNYDQAGAYGNIKFAVNDGVNNVEEPITITVNNTNRSPVITPIGNKTGNEGELLQFSVSATDPDGDKVTYSILNAPEGAKIDANTGLFEWTPTYKQAGSYVVTFVASDGSASAGETITITVNNVRRPDLTVGKISYSPAKPRPGSQVQFKALIRNIGDMKTGKFRVSLNVAGETKTKTISGLAAGRSTYTIFYWKAKKGTHTVTVTADPANMIQEQDEDNNVGQREVVVK